MKKVLFFTETEWAFGSIHYELIKYFFRHRINASVMPWDKPYSQLEINELVTAVDYFISSPYGVAILIDRYCVPPEKCIAVAHAILDIECLQSFLPEYVQRLHGYSAVSQWLVDQSQLRNINRVPMLTPVGINYAAYHSTINTHLSVVGYAGAINANNIHRAIKRYWLIEQATKSAGLEFRAAHHYHNSWVTMPGFYKQVDAVVIASTEEGAGLPALEASAAGKLVISTPVGIWLAKAGASGHTVPIDESEFVKQTVDLLNYYRDNPTAYQQKCLETQQHAQCYDWENVIQPWVNLVQ
jgi:glycosyltransferase involved in cell wall biosynthesis